MATAYTPDTEHGDDNFILELNRVKEKVRTRFIKLRECLSERESELMRELDEILSSYECYRREVEKMNEERRDIENVRNANMGVVTTSAVVRSCQEKMLQELNEQLEGLEIPVKPKLVMFVCEESKWLVEVNKLCKLVEVVSEIDYKSRTRSVMSVCDGGNGNEQLNSPRGVTVDHKTGNIYVADTINRCVKVFNDYCKFVFKFGDLKGEGSMTYPNCLVICHNRVLVSQSNVFIEASHCIKVYQFDGKFVCQIGKRGGGELQFNSPWGLATNESTGDIYICDRDNNRVQIISEHFQYKSQFGKDTLHSPLDVKLYRDNIFILDQSNPCLHIYNKDLVLQKSVVSSGGGRQQVVLSLSFFIDRFGNILISDYNSDSILILSSEFVYIHKISLSNSPMGITMDNKDRIVVVSRAVKNSLQIF